MEKREHQKAERRWQKTNLQVHCDIYKERVYIFNLELKMSRQSLFSDINTKNKNNACALFATVDRLTNPPVPVADEHLSTRACNEFASFFTAKILKKLDKQSVPLYQVQEMCCCFVHLTPTLIP